MYDVIVIGAGPAGLSAAINVRQRGGNVAVIGLPMENNPLWKAERIDNYPGMPGVNGEQMLTAFYQHARDAGAEMIENRVLATYYQDGLWMVSAGPDVYTAYALVFAGGITRGRPFEGEEAHIGMGVSYCATCDGMLYRGRDVAVIGFGAADRREAEYLEEIGCHVTYLEKPRQVEIVGDGQVSGLIADGEEFSVSCVFILRPSLAPSSLFPQIELEGNYIRTDRMMATNLPALFAAGDCTGRPLQIAKSIGEGMIAGQNAMASAVLAKKNIQH